MKKITLLLLLIISSTVSAQKLRIDNISYGTIGKNEGFNDTYFFTKKSIKKTRKFYDPNKDIEENEIEFTVKQWLDLLKTFDIESFKEIKNQRSVTTFGGVDTFITLTYINGKSTKVVNAHDNELWLNIQSSLDEIKKELDNEN